MTIKTIMVHLTPDENSKARLEAAVKLAKRLDGYLLTLYVAAPVHLPPGAEGRGASAAFLANAREKARNMAGDVEESARKACEDAGVPWRWVYGHSDHLEDILAEAHHVDLTIIGQVSIDRFEDRLMLQLPEKLAMDAGGPVLVLPTGHVGDGLDKANTVMVAWTYSKEAIRAVRESLSILKSADRVVLLTCASNDGTADAEPILNYLERQGVSAEHQNGSKDGSLGDQILDKAHENKADMIVMGAYGHTGFIDKLFGSTTRYVVGHTDLPLLISH